MKEELLLNMDKIHTSYPGMDRISKNLNINRSDVIKYCKDIILNKESTVYKKGKNYYAELSDIKLTINSYTFTIITAHKLK